MNIIRFNRFNEKNDSDNKNWINKAIKQPDSLRKHFKKKDGEEISKKEINDELKRLKSKDKDKSKKGIQGLSNKDLKLYRQLNLAKNLKSIKESDQYENDNYMFFANLDHICRMVTDMKSMNEDMIDDLLTNGHDWANDHMSKSMESIEHVYNFLLNHNRDRNIKNNR